MAKKIKLYKQGKAVAVNGKSYEFSEAQLKAAAAAYDPELHAAPLVIGHPKLDDPKYGQIQVMSFADGFLLGEPTNVDPAFAELVNSGKYDRVSISFYAPDSPANPVPGVLYPRHVGFLGATPPGCKGLGAVSFAEGEEGIINFGDWNDRLAVRMWRNLKNFLIGEFGQEKADKVLDEWDLQAITEEAVRPDPPVELEPAFAEHHKGVAMKLTDEQAVALENENRALKAALKGNVIAAAHSANLSFAEGLVKEGRLLPVNQAKIVAVLDFAAGLEEGSTIEFGEGDGKKTATVVETLKDVLLSNPKIIEFGELGGGEGPAGGKEPIIPVKITDCV